MIRMQNGGKNDPPEATADITRNPLARELFDEVVSSAKKSPEFTRLRDERNDPINRGGDRVLDQVREQNIGRAQRRLMEADIAGLRGGLSPMSFDQNMSGRPNDPDFAWKNFTELVNAGDEDALQVLQSMDQLYRERNPTPVLRPVSEMFGIR
jgi:hypothetical protein